MDGQPSPMQSPSQWRTASQDSVPSILQVGSPIISNSPVSSYQPTPPPPRAPSRSDERLSQLFPTRPSSVASYNGNTRQDPSRRDSHPIALTPSSPPIQSDYASPQASTFPTFPSNTSYDDSRSYHGYNTYQPDNVSRTRSILNRLGSLRSPNFLQRNDRYNQLDDQEERSRGHSRRKRLKEVSEEDDDAPIGYDISGFGGPIAMQSFGQGGRGQAAAHDDGDLGLATISQDAECNRPEGPHKDAVIGGGMVGIVEISRDPSRKATPAPKRMLTLHKRGLSNSNIEAQHAADQQGEIVAVTEQPAFDISNFGGGDIETSSLANEGRFQRKKEEKSYAFPVDTNMPNWRPISMHWAYLSILISIALALAILQELLCQRSIQKAKEGTGLLEFTEANELSVLEYFTWKYAPTMVLVTYGVFWQVTDYEVKRLEPFYQLSRKKGATAAESLNIDYLTFFSYFVPFKAISHRQYAVFLSSFGYLLAGSIVPVLQSAAVSIYPERERRKADEPKFVRIDPPWSRAVTAMLVLVACIGIALMFLSRRKSGLQSDPKGIAGVAAMATRSHILADFEGLDTAPQHIIHKQLRHRRYILHKSSLWQGEFIRNDNSSLKDHSRDSRPALLTKRAGIPYITYIISFAILVPVFMFIPAANTATSKIPFLLTALATALKLLWGTFDMAVRLMEPFYILSCRRAPPQTLTLDYTGTIPGYLSIRAFLNKHYLVALVGLGSIFTEVLTVCASSFSVDGQKFVIVREDNPPDGRPDRKGGRIGLDFDGAGDSDTHNSGETLKSFWTSFALTYLILIYLLVVYIFVLRSRGHKMTPRTPGTVASTLAFIHQSKMLLDFVDTETFSSGRMTRHLQQLGKTYGLGWFNGRDGVDHCGIEEEPLLAGYVWGKDWGESRMVGGVVGSWDHY